MKFSLFSSALADGLLLFLVSPGFVSLHPGLLIFNPFGVKKQPTRCASSSPFSGGWPHPRPFPEREGSKAMKALSDNALIGHLKDKSTHPGCESPLSRRGFGGGSFIPIGSCLIIKGFHKKIAALLFSIVTAQSMI